KTHARRNTQRVSLRLPEPNPAQQKHQPVSVQHTTPGRRYTPTHTRRNTHTPKHTHADTLPHTPAETHTTDAKHIQDIQHTHMQNIIHIILVFFKSLEDNESRPFYTSLYVNEPKRSCLYHFIL